MYLVTVSNFCIAYGQIYYWRDKEPKLLEQLNHLFINKISISTPGRRRDYYSAIDSNYYYFKLFYGLSYYCIILFYCIWFNFILIF